MPSLLQISVTVNNFYFVQVLWRHGGLVVSVSDFRSGGWWFEPRFCHRVVSSDKRLFHTVSLSSPRCIHVNEYQ